MINLSKESLMRSKKKALAAVLLAAAMTATGLMLEANPAQAAVTYTVNSIGDGADLDPKDGVCDANPSPSVFECTLRAAIQEVNTTSGESTINFNIPSGSGDSIRPNSSLPFISGQVTIDGYTPPGASPNTLQVLYTPTLAPTYRRGIGQKTYLLIGP